jgi:hypothetical protein
MKILRWTRDGEAESESQVTGRRYVEKHSSVVRDRCTRYCLPRALGHGSERTVENFEMVNLGHAIINFPRKVDQSSVDARPCPALDSSTEQSLSNFVQ